MKQRFWSLMHLLLCGACTSQGGAGSSRAASAAQNTGGSGWGLGVASGGSASGGTTGGIAGGAVAVQNIPPGAAGRLSAGGSGGVSGPGPSVGGEPVVANPLPSGGWLHRRLLTLNVPALAEELADFPVLLRIQAADVTGARDDGSDLRFVSSDNNQELPFEVQHWDPRAESLVWVRLGSVHVAPTQTSFWVYYGNALAQRPLADAAHNPWGAPFSGVWHLDGGAKDSSPNAFDGVSAGAAQWVNGVVGTAFNSTWTPSLKPHIVLKHDINVVGGATSATISAWVRPAPEFATRGVIATFGKSATTDHSSYIDLNIEEGMLMTHVDPMDDPGTYQEAVSPVFPALTMPTWSWAVVVVDLSGGTVAFYLDGSPAGETQSLQFNASRFSALPSNRSVFGSEEDESSNDYEGSIDEVRVDQAARSASWVREQYRAYSDPEFVQWGPAEPVPAL